MPDDLIREIPLLKRYARHNEAQDIRFRAYVKFDLNLSNEELDTVVREVTDRVWAQIDCTACANCCKSLQVFVDSADIRRLATRLGMTPVQFKKLYVAQDGDGSQYFAHQPCALLGEDNRCTVYEDRPTACRDFPFLHKEGFRHRTMSMLIHQEDCPIVFNVWQQLKQRLKRRKR